MQSTRHKSPNGAIRTAQRMAREGFDLLGYGFEGDTFVMHWSAI